MNGAIANILKGDEQIGGLLDWDLRIVSNKGSDGENQTEKVIDWIITAQKHWHFKDVEMPVAVVFYKFEDGTLFQVDRKMCLVTFKGGKDVVNGPIELESWIAS